MVTGLNLKTPGREADEEETKLYTRKDMNSGVNSGKNTDNNDSNKTNGKARDTKSKADAISSMILTGLGGKANISDIDCCATRLRVTVKNSEIVNDACLRKTGASGVIHKGNGVQVIYGPSVSVIKSNLEDYMDKPENDSISLAVYMKGDIISLEDVDDEAFANHVLGEGVAIEPKEGKLYSPCDGVIDNVFDTKHAITLTADDGPELLMHIGIDTVKLKGKYYETHVTAGQSVKTGDLLVSFDIDGIKNEGYKVTTPLVVCNMDDYNEIEIVNFGSATPGKTLLTLK